MTVETYFFGSITVIPVIPFFWSITVLLVTPFCVWTASCNILSQDWTQTLSMGTRLAQTRSGPASLSLLFRETECSHVQGQAWRTRCIALRGWSEVWVNTKVWHQGKRSVQSDGFACDCLDCAPQNSSKSKKKELGYHCMDISGSEWGFRVQGLVFNMGSCKQESAWRTGAKVSVVSSLWCAAWMFWGVTEVLRVEGTEQWVKGRGFHMDGMEQEWAHRTGVKVSNVCTLGSVAFMIWSDMNAREWRENANRGLWGRLLRRHFVYFLGWYAMLSSLYHVVCLFPLDSSLTLSLIAFSATYNASFYFMFLSLWHAAQPYWPWYVNIHSHVTICTSIKNICVHIFLCNAVWVHSVQCGVSTSSSVCFTDSGRACCIRAFCVQHAQSCSVAQHYPAVYMM